MFCPLWSIGWPSMTQPSPPSGSLISRGARSFHLSGTYRTHRSGGVSTWPSAEMTWYFLANSVSPFLELLMDSHPVGANSGAKAISLQVAVRVAPGQAPERRCAHRDLYIARSRARERAAAHPAARRLRGDAAAGPADRPQPLLRRIAERAARAPPGGGAGALLPVNASGASARAFPELAGYPAGARRAHLAA